MPEKQQRIQKHLMRFYKITLTVFTILMILSLFNKGIPYDGGLLKVTNSGTEILYSGEPLIHGPEMRIQVWSSTENETVVKHTHGEGTDLYTVQYPLGPVSTKYGDMPGLRILKNGIILFNGAYTPENGWFNSRGEWSPPAHSAGFNEQDALYFAQAPEPVARGSWKHFLFSVALTLLFMLCTACPEDLFEMRHRGLIQNPQPTELWYRRLSVTWVLMALTSLISFLIAWSTIT